MPANSMLLTSASRGRISILAGIFFCLVLIFIFRSNLIETAPWPSSPAPDPPTAPETKTGDSPPAHQQQPTPAAKDPCDGFPDTSDILLIMKTGATEAYDKLPIHFLTTLKCAKDVIIFSDSEMQMGDYHLIDTLDEIGDDVKKDNGDFNLYSTLKEYERFHQDPRALKNGGNGWTLDKYKFLPMMVRTWRHREDAKWYVFLEADSGINWYNLRTFLDKLNSEKPYYIGSPTYLDIEFAHGGTGYIISGAAMRKAVGGHPDIQKKYDSDIKPWCCGDRIIARVLLDEGIKLTKAWPMLNGEKPLTLPFGENQWCQPVITMHHMTAQEVSQVWNYQQRRLAAGNTDPIMWMDIYDEFVHNNLEPVREDWTNLSGDLVYEEKKDKEFHGLKWDQLSDDERGSINSADSCKKVCENNEDCFQWEHHDKECRIGRSFKLGGSKKGEPGGKWVAGWKFPKIGDFRAKMNNCSKGPDWTFHEPDGWLG